MSGSEFVANSIEDILVSIASGITDAQDKLNRLEPFDEYGRPKPQYFLPHLDFTLKVNTVATNTVTRSQTGGKERAPYSYEKHSPTDFSTAKLNFVMAGPSSSTSSSTQEIHSTLSGRFVAIPANEGMPQYSIRATVTEDGSQPPYSHIVNITVQHPNTDPGASLLVEFNIDIESTRTANAQPGLELQPFDVFETGILTTDSSGVATNRIILPALSTGAASGELHMDVNIGPQRVGLVVAEQQ